MQIGRGVEVVWEEGDRFGLALGVILTIEVAVLSFPVGWQLSGCLIRAAIQDSISNQKQLKFSFLLLHEVRPSGRIGAWTACEICSGQRTRGDACSFGIGGTSGFTCFASSAPQLLWFGGYHTAIYHGRAPL